MRTLYRASRVYSLSSRQPGEWILIDGRHVERVGVGEPPSADRVVDLVGATILPGFIDSHVHLTGTGVHLQAPELGTATSREELLEVVRRVVESREGPVLVHGYDESKWADRTVPSISDLDAVSDRPLAVVRVDGHVTLANAAALNGSDVLERDGVERDPGGGLTGRVTRDANATLRRWFSMHLVDHDIEELQLAAASHAVAYGVTTVHEMSMPHERGLRDLEVLLAHRARLPLDVVTYVATTDVPQVMDLGLSRIGGDLPVDGSIGARTASVSEAYADGGTGVRYYEDDELATFFHDGYLAGLQVGVHAIGDAAIEQVISTWERIYMTLDSRGRRHFRARRHRIEHFEMASTAIVERAAAIGLAISVQPTFDAEWGSPGGLYDQALGWDRAEPMNPFRVLLDRGVELGAGSDTPITTIDPLVTVAALEAHHDVEQRMRREDAIRLCTLGSARLAHHEEKKGSLEPGKHADFAVYDTDPMTADDLRGVGPILTVSLGREVFAS
jgi:predicted amidohydrolase YtcJ